MPVSTATRPSPEAVRLQPIVADFYNADINEIYSEHNVLVGAHNDLDTRLTDAVDATEADILALENQVFGEGVVAVSSPHTVDTDGGTSLYIPASLVNPVVILPDPTDLTHGLRIVCNSHATCSLMTIRVTAEGGATTDQTCLAGGTWVATVHSLGGGVNGWKVSVDDRSAIPSHLVLALNTSHTITAEMLRAYDMFSLFNLGASPITLTLPDLSIAGTRRLIFQLSGLGANVLVKYGLTTLVTVSGFGTTWYEFVGYPHPDTPGWKWRVITWL